MKSVTNGLGLMSRLAIGVALSLTTAVANAQLLDNGDFLVACKPADDNVTLGIKNLAEMGRIWSDPVNRGSFEWSPQVPAKTMWTTADFGGKPVFSMDVDMRDESIYTVTTGMYWNFNPDPGVIYRIDGTGVPAAFANLPGGSGGAYLQVDEVNDQLYAIDMDMGQIVRIPLSGASAGTIVEVFDPFVADPGADNAYAPLGERLLGVEYNVAENRVYYSVWANDYSGNGSGGPANTIRSIGLLGTGGFDTASDKLEISLPTLTRGSEVFDFSMPVGDIEFDDSGTKLLLSEVGFDSSTPQSKAHHARQLEYGGSSAGGWAISVAEDKYEAGSLYEGTNARGGSDWAFEGIVNPQGGVLNDEDFVIFTMDGYAIGEYVPPSDIYGFQFYSDAGGDSATDSIVVDLDGDTENGQDKGVYGDIDVFHRPLAPTPYDLALRKQPYWTQTGVEVGQQAIFMIEVINQASVNSGAFTVTDQLPAGTSFVSANGTNYSCTHDGSADGGLLSCNYTSSLIPGEVGVIYLTVQVNDAAMAPYRNWAEIASDSGPDADSTPGDNGGADNAAGTGTPGSDPVVDHDDLDHYAPNDDALVDEDDSDYEDLDIGVYDLALTKHRRWQSGPVGSGDTVNYIVKITNQGSISSGAYSFREHIPAGMRLSFYDGTEFTCVDSSGGALTAGSGGGVNVPGPDYVDCTANRVLMPGQYVWEGFTTIITDITMAPFRNWAEIETDSGTDVDSEPGDNDAIDSGAGTGGIGNDVVINHNDIDHANVAWDEQTEDEDDSDFEDVGPALYDLAIIKTLAAGQSATVANGDSVVYEIQMVNQGNQDANSYSFVDQIPAGMSFVSAVSSQSRDETGAPTYTDDVTCTEASGLVTCTGNHILTPACSVGQGGCPSYNPVSTDFITVTLTLQVDDVTKAPFRNWVEIETDDGSDDDSTPGSNDGNDDDTGTGIDGKDNVIDHDDISHVDPAWDEQSEDEDDSDYEDVDVDAEYDLALIKELASGQASDLDTVTSLDVDYVITIKNQGDVDSGAFSVTDVIPAGMAYWGATPAPDGAPAINSTGTLTWSFPASQQIVAGGADKTITLKLRVRDASLQPFRNWAEIETDSGDDVDSAPGDNNGDDNATGTGTAGSDPVVDHDDIDHADPNDDPLVDEDDSDYEDVTITPRYDLALVKTQFSTFTNVVNGDIVIYLLTYKNHGNIPSGEWSISEVIPDGMSLHDDTPKADGAPAVGFTGTLVWTSTPGSTGTTLPELGPGGGGSVILKLKVDDVTKGPFRNWAEIESDSGDDADSDPGDNDADDNGPGTGTAGTDPVINHNDIDHDDPTYDERTEDEDDSDFEDVGVDLEYDLALIKELSSGQASAVTEGDNVSYTITIQNQGVADSGVYTVSDMIPAGMSFVSSVPAAVGPPAVGATGLVTWSMPNLQGNLATPAEATITLVLKVDDATNSPFRNWAEIESIPATQTDEDSTPGSNDGNDSGTGDGGNGNDDVTNHNNVDTDEPAGDEDDSDYEDITATAPPEYDLALIKELSSGQAATVAVGDNVSYTITIQNQGVADSGVYTVSDMIPTGMSFVSSVPAAVGPPAAGATGLITWSMPNLLGNQATPAEATITLVLKVDSAANAPFRNWAEIETIPATATDNDSTPGSNDGNDNTTGTGPAGSDDVDNHNNVDTDEPVGDEDDSDYEDVGVTPEYDLALIKELSSGQAASVAVGDNVSFTITIQNQGVADSGVYTVSDMIPTGMSFVSSVPAAVGPPAAGATGLITWSMPNLLGNQATPAEATITLVLKVDDATNAPFRNWAEIETIPGTATDNDSTPGSNDGNDNTTGTGPAGSDDVDNHNNVDTDEPAGDEDDSDYEDVAVTAATPEYDLALIKELSSGQAASVAVGDNVSYTITIQNQGVADSGVYTVSDMIPTGMSFVSSVPAAVGPPAAGATGLITWSMPNLLGNQATPAEATITLVLKVDDATNAPFRNWAEIETIPGTETDEDSTPGSNDGNDNTTGTGPTGNDDVDDHNNVDTDEPVGDEDDSDYADVAVTSTTPEYDLALIKELSSGQAASVAVGDNVSYTITIQNQGAADSGVYTVSDMIPTGMSFVSSVPAAAGPPAAGATGLITWSMPNLLGGQATPAEATITLVLKVDDATNAPFRNWAEIETIPATETDEDSTPGSNDGNDNTTGTGPTGNDDVDDHNNVDTDEPVGDEDDSDYEDVTVTTGTPDRYDLALVKHLAPGQASWIVSGSTVDYEIFVKNQGNVASGDFVVVDSVPTGMQWVPLTAYGPGVNCVHDGSPTGGLATCSYTAPSGTALAPNQTIVINVSLLVTDITQAPFANWAEITEDSSADYGVTDDDSQPNDNNAQDTAPGDNSTAGDPFEDQTDIEADPNTPATEEDDSDPAYVYSASTTPITLESFLVDMQPGGSMATFHWSTSMEDGNVGFNLYGRSAGTSWKKLNSSLIPATSTDSDGAQYSAAQFGVTATEFAITDVDLFGKETVHGPFEANQQYGLDQNDPEEQVSEPIEQTEDEAETPVVATTGSVYLRVKRDGVQRVSFKDLAGAGHDWTDVHVDNLAVTLGDQAIPARVVGNASDDIFSQSLFGPGGYIEFIGHMSDNIMAKHNVYRLALDPSNALRISAELTSPAPATSAAFMDTAKWEEDKIYSRVAPSDDPWYARKLLSLTTTTSEKVSVNVPGAVSGAAGAITVNVWGGHDDLSVLKENRVKVMVNGVDVIDTDIGGLQVHVLEGQIPAGTLVDGSNDVKIKVSRANGANMALVNLDSIEIDYARQFRAEGGALTLDSDATGFTVAGVNDPVVYRSDANGVARVLTNSANGSASFAGTGAMAEYFVADSTAINTPKVRNVPAIGDMTSGPAEYLVITHRKFRGGALERLVMARQADGLTTKVVDVDWIYDVYAGGNVSTDAIRDYIAFAAAELDTRYVVLVGGDTYDYRNILGKKAKSFIPTLYAQTTEAVSHAPVDPLYGDVDNDGIPDLAVGRLPVQDKIQLRHLVNKTLQYAQATYGSTAIMAADDIDDSSQADFGALTDAMVQELPEGWTRKKAYLGKLSRNNAREKVVRNINKGVALTTWMGHSDLKIWGFNRLLRNKDINALTNNGKPTVVTQYGCWNTYYVDPNAKSMAHTWLNAKNGGGAAVVTGASTLTEVASEQALSVIVTRLLTTTDMTIGEAILAAKQQMASEQPLDAIRDVISGYIILGDPAVRIAK